MLWLFGMLWLSTEKKNSSASRDHISVSRDPASVSTDQISLSNHLQPAAIVVFVNSSLFMKKSKIDKTSLLSLKRWVKSNIRHLSLVTSRCSCYYFLNETLFFFFNASPYILKPLLWSTWLTCVKTVVFIHVTALCKEKDLPYKGIVSSSNRAKVKTPIYVSHTCWV